MESNTKIPANLENEYTSVAWALEEKWKEGVKFVPINIPRANVGDMDVNFELIYSGVCHSDLHVGMNDFGSTVYPFVGGHELLGKVLNVGAKVTKFKVGDHVGVGCLVDSCLDCLNCDAGDEQLCLKGSTGTYNGVKKYGRATGNTDLRTHGGYSQSHTVHENFVVKIPDGIPLECAAPILCAGITMYDPLKHWGAVGGEKMTIGIVGIGGLGTMGVKIAKALGHTVVAISSSENKKELALKKGADHFVVSKDPESMKSQSMKIDLILNTVSADHDVKHYMTLLAKKGTIVQLGLVLKPQKINMVDCMYTKKKVAGSGIGGIRATQEVLDLCAKHQIWPDCQVIKADQIGWAWETLSKINADALRYVIDVKASLEDKNCLPAE